MREPCACTQLPLHLRTTLACVASASRADRRTQCLSGSQLTNAQTDGSLARECNYSSSSSKGLATKPRLFASDANNRMACCCCKPQPRASSARLSVCASARVDATVLRQKAVVKNGEPKLAAFSATRQSHSVERFESELELKLASNPCTRAVNSKPDTQPEQ